MPTLNLPRRGLQTLLNSGFELFVLVLHRWLRRGLQAPRLGHCSEADTRTSTFASWYCSDAEARPSNSVSWPLQWSRDAGFDPCILVLRDAETRPSSSASWSLQWCWDAGFDPCILVLQWCWGAAFKLCVFTITMVEMRASTLASWYCTSGYD